MLRNHGLRSSPASPPPARAVCRRRPCCTRRPHTRCPASSSAACDALLVDAQNVLSRAGSGGGGGGRRLSGEGVAGSFAAWLQFLAAVARPQLIVAVFDAPSSKRQAQQQQRQQLAPEYLQRRKRRRQTGSNRQDGSGSSSGSGGDPLRPFKQQVQQLGGVCLEAAAGWEADDGLAAACAALRQRHPAARLLVASGDKDMQQLLDPQVPAATDLRAWQRWLAAILPPGWAQ